MTDMPWWVNLAAIATALTALGIIWRMLIVPVFKAIWMAIIAAPRIPVILDEVKAIIESDVLGKLEEMRVEFAKHEAESAQHIARLDHHTTQLENHEIRIAALERDK